MPKRKAPAVTKRVTTYGKVHAYCCEAQMYLCLVGQPSATFTFCAKCNGFYRGGVSAIPPQFPADSE